jgi:hypothetical protein
MQTKKTAPFGVLNSTKQVDSSISSILSVIPIYLSAHVRWPGQTSGAFGLALIFLVLFASRPKERKVKKQIYLRSFFCLCKRKNQRKAHRQ